MQTAGKRILGLGLASALSMAVGHAQTPPAVTGFDAAAASAELELESRFDKAIQPGNLKPWLERFAARPHHVGSPYDKANADYIAELFTSWGFDTRIERFDVLFPTPRTRILELTAPTRYTARLAEPALSEDPTSNQAAEQLPVYNAYSANGDVTGPLVYVNYGVPADYDELARHGVSVKGAIVIARYGGSWRGIKPKVAAEHGALGCLIYSDPREDGYFQGEVYPKGAFRSEWGAQRGSVMDMPLYPGDPLTPGVGATPDAKRLALTEAPTLTKIPVLPISYADARPLLEALGGQTAPEAWRGALPLTYRLGPGPATVHLKLEFDFAQKPVYDVIATLAGRERPDQWVIRGNHHDAWVHGAADPVSGLVAMLAEAQAVGTLAKAGWRPRRTIVYAAWDGEEEGLLGSTEWVESHADELSRKAVAYINTDGYGRGFLDAGGSHGLERMVNEAARSVNDPETSVSVAARARAVAILGADSADKRREIRARGDLAIDALGSGSDFTPFLQHLGIPTLNVGFGGEDAGGEYHSIYDSIAHYERFKDPGFVYGPVLAQFGGPARPAAGRSPVPPHRRGAAGRDDRRLREGAGETGRHRAREDRRGEPAAQGPDLSARRGSHQGQRAAAHGGARAVPESGSAPECVGPAHDGRRSLRRRGCGSEERLATGISRVGCATRCRASRHRPGLLQRGGAASPPVVQAPDLRARLLHRLRREDRSRRPRSHRAAHVEGGRRRGRPGR